MLTVTLGFGKQAGLRALSAPPPPPPLPQRVADVPRVEDHPADIAENTEAAANLPAEARAAEPGPETDQLDKPADLDAPPSRTQRRHRLLTAAETSGAADEPEAAASEEPAAESALEESAAAPPEANLPEAGVPEAATPEAAETEHAESAPHKPAHPHRLEMTIDSLPHHELTEPIPIVIDPLGDTIFTASMSNLDISATGNSIGEGLLLLKEQIEFVYSDLSRRSSLTADQKTTLQMLHTYIRPNGPKKPEWF